MASQYGWKDEYLEGMKDDLFNSYYFAIDAMKAEDRIHNINASCYSDMDKKNQKKYYKSLERSYKSILEKDKNAKALSMEDFARTIALGMTGG